MRDSLAPAKKLSFALLSRWNAKEILIGSLLGCQPVMAQLELS